MLKSTHKPRPPSGGSLSPLPPGWTEHRAPTGHSYYYNAATKQSTYTRPAFVVANPQPLFQQPIVNPLQFHSGANTFGFPGAHGFSNIPQSHGSSLQFHRGSFRGRVGGARGGSPHQYHERRRRNEPRDRPRSKHSLPGVTDWVMVKTKLQRRFVHNVKTKQSLWKVPEESRSAVEAFDEREARRTRGEETPPSTTGAALDDASEPKEPGPSDATGNQGKPTDPEEDSDYEMVEVTDEEEESEAKGPDLSAENRPPPPDPQEFNEDDIAFQLASMGAEYGLDPTEYDAGDGLEELEEGVEGEPLSEADTIAVFRELLDDFGVNPYWTWEKIIEEGTIIEDVRYTVLPNMRTRREAWTTWSQDRIREMKEKREREEKTNPLIPYLQLLQEKATSKLYWAEFRRKYKKDNAMRDDGLTDKQREKWYRDYIDRKKLPLATLKADLTALLRSFPLQTLNASTSPEHLPTELITHLHYLPLLPTTRDPLVEGYITTLPPPPQDPSSDPASTHALPTDENHRVAQALHARAQQVQREKHQQERRLRAEQENLRREEMELQRVTTLKGSKLGALLKAQDMVDKEKETDDEVERSGSKGRDAKSGK